MFLAPEIFTTNAPKCGSNNYSSQKRQPEIPVTVGGWTGDVISEKGGASLKFEGKCQ